MAEVAKNTIDISQISIEEEKIVPPWKEAWLTFYKNKIALVGLGIVIFFIVIAILHHITHA